MLMTRPQFDDAIAAPTVSFLHATILHLFHPQRDDEYCFEITNSDTFVLLNHRISNAVVQSIFDLPNGISVRLHWHAPELVGSGFLLKTTVRRRENPATNPRSCGGSNISYLAKKTTPLPRRAKSVTRLLSHRVRLGCARALPTSIPSQLPAKTQSLTEKWLTRKCISRLFWFGSARAMLTSILSRCLVKCTFGINQPYLHPGRFA